MEVGPLPRDVDALLRERIASFEQLEILLLLRRGHQHAWTSESVAEEIHVAPAIAAEALDHLCRRNLLEVHVGNAALSFRYSAGSPDLDGAVKALAEAYAARRLDVMRALSENALARVRTSAMRMFADAFLVGRGKKDG